LAHLSCLKNCFNFTLYHFCDVQIITVQHPLPAQTFCKQTYESCIINEGYKNVMTGSIAHSLVYYGYQNILLSRQFWQNFNGSWDGPIHS